MVEEDLGEATIVYEDPDDGTIERQVQNEHIAYFQDHWIIKTGEDEEGRDTVRRVPHRRVYYVERSVEAFEEEVQTITDRVQSVADELRSRIGSASAGGRDGGGTDEPHRLEIDQGSGESGGDEGGSQ